MSITYNGTNSDTLNLITRLTSIPIMPTPKENIVDSPYFDGVIDISSFNKDGRIHYNERTFEIEVGLCTNTSKDRTILARSIAKWIGSNMSEYVPIEFSEIPDRIWYGRPNGQLLLNPITFTKGKAIVQFRCKPFAFSAAGDVNGNASGTTTSIMLEGDVMQNLNLSFVKSDTETIITTAYESLFIPPDLTGNITIDGKKLEVMANLNVVTRHVQGSFPKVRTGANTISVSNVSDFNYSYTPQYLL